MSPTLPPPPLEQKSNNFLTNDTKEIEDITVTVKNIMYKNITGKNAM
jgi:hypothetical protein